MTPRFFLVYPPRCAQMALEKLRFMDGGHSQPQEPIPPAWPTRASSGILVSGARAARNSRNDPAAQRMSMRSGSLMRPAVPGQIRPIDICPSVQLPAANLRNNISCEQEPVRDHFALWHRLRRHNARRCPAQGGEAGAVKALPVLGDAAAAVKPGNRTPDDPSSKQDRDPVQLRAPVVVRGARPARTFRRVANGLPKAATRSVSRLPSLPQAACAAAPGQAPMAWCPASGRRRPAMCCSGRVLRRRLRGQAALSRSAKPRATATLAASCSLCWPLISSVIRVPSRTGKSRNRLS
jgi:hypothetical protein